VAALALGLVNAIVRPVLILLTLPVTVVTLGLFILVLNGLLFWLVGSFVEGFVVQGFWAGFFGAILFSIVSWLLSALVLKGGK
jgi:putative membrane protein